MNYMFYKCDLYSIDLSLFNNSNVIKMRSMFSNCYYLNIINLSSFNTNNVKYMDSMFAFCSSLISLD